MTLRILTVDDHPLIRQGIAAMLEVEADMHLVGEAGDASEGIALFRQLLPDVALVDLQLPGMGGIEMTRRLRDEFPGARVVILTTYRGDANAREALAAGASGYLLKSSLRGELIDALLDHIREEEDEFFPLLKLANLDLSAIALEMGVFEANLVHMQAQFGGRGMRH